jgi:hypothetical protein
MSYMGALEEFVKANRVRPNWGIKVIIFALPQAWLPKARKALCAREILCLSRKGNTFLVQKFQ